MSHSHHTILVLGGTGAVGQWVVKFLADKGVHVKVGTRAPESQKAGKASSHPTGKIELVKVDYNHPETIVAAAKGVERVFLAQSAAGHTHVIEEGKKIAHALKEAGVKVVVKLSVYGVGHSDESRLVHAHHEVESQLTSAGIVVLSLRPTMFYSNLFMQAQSIKSQGVSYFAFDDGAKFNWINNKDIGEVGATLLTSESIPSSHTGYDVLGHDISLKEINHHFSEVLGKEVKNVNPGLEKFQQTLLGFGMNQELVEDIIGHIKSKGNSSEDKDHVVEKITGHPPTSVKEFIQENAHAFK